MRVGEKWEMRKGKLSSVILFPEWENSLSWLSSGGKSIWAFSCADIFNYLKRTKTGVSKVEDNSDETFALKLNVATDCLGGKYNSPVLLNIDSVGNWNFRPNSYFRPVFLYLPISLLFLLSIILSIYKSLKTANIAHFILYLFFYVIIKKSNHVYIDEEEYE